MLRLNRQTRVAITILVECAKCPGSILRTADVAKLAGSTPMGTAAISHLLMRGELLSTRRGRYGGVMLGRPTADITLADVFQTCELEMAIEEPRGTEHQMDPVDLSFLDAAGTFMHTLARTTIAGICEQRALLSRQQVSTTAVEVDLAQSSYPPIVYRPKGVSRGKGPSRRFARQDHNNSSTDMLNA